MSSQAIANTTRNIFSLPAAIQVFLASCFIAICAQISVPLYFTPVPLTGQTFGVMLVGALCGRTKGAYAALAYLFQGACGLPVLAGGCGGIHCLFGLTGGYLLGFIVEAYLAGKYAKDSNTLVFFLISLLQLTIGTCWLAAFVGMKAAFALGFLPFIGGEFVKSWFVSSIYKKWKTL